MKIRPYLIMIFFLFMPFAVFAQQLGASEEVSSRLLYGTIGALLAIIWWIVQQWIKDKKEFEKSRLEQEQIQNKINQEVKIELQKLSDAVASFSEMCKFRHP